jgi:aspartyl-tRNA(Asn)/glutamyl-tRNA(Gln) amidotransferase subunit A
MRRMSELADLTLLELLDALRTRQASPVELMHAVLAADDATQASLNALVARRERDDLLAEARAAEKRIADGSARALEGIPFGVKDLEDAVGLPTTQGSLLFRDHVAKQDSTQVARLKADGAIVVGKTTTPEFGHTAITKNLVHGVTRSPWSEGRTPGGSSGGSAALLAAGVLPLATGSDGGGSIRIPASFCGLVGLKPSFGRIPKGPSELWDDLKTSVVGPMTKTVLDAAYLLDRLAGPHPHDPTSLPPSGVSFFECCREPVPRLRLGYARDLGYAVVQSDVAAVVDRAVTAFEELGHTVESVSGGPPEMGAEWGLLNAVYLRAELAHHLPRGSAEVTRALVSAMDLAAGITPEWRRATAARRVEVVTWCASIFERYDALLTPTVPYDPPPAGGPLPSETEGRKQPLASAGSFTIPFNLSWHPAVTVRAGLSRAGLPVGLQIVAPQHRDDRALMLAYAFESARPWHPHWPRPPR